VSSARFAIRRTGVSVAPAEDAVQTTDSELRVQVNRREVSLREMPVASVLAGLPMTGLADIAIDLTIPSAGGNARRIRST
jgi:hypothetical protein